MKTEYRGIVAIALSAAFFILWYTVISPPKPAPQAGRPGAEMSAQPAAQTAIQKAENQAPATPAKTEKKGAPDPQANVPIKAWTLKNSQVEIDLTSDGAVPASIRMLDYHKTPDKGSPLIDLVLEEDGLAPPLSLSFKKANFEFPERPRYELISADERRAVFKWRSAEVEVQKEISIEKSGYLVNVNVEVKNLSKTPLTARPAVGFSGIVPPSKDGDFFSFLKQPALDNQTPVFYLDGKTHREANTAKIGGENERTGALLWAGLESRYFLGAVIPRITSSEMSVEFGALSQGGDPAGSKGLFAGAVMPSVSIPDGDTAEAKFSVYAGPKEMNELKGVGVHLDEAMDYGFFTIVAIPILYLLKFFYGLINNYGVAIILLTIFVKILLHPINVKSLKSMKAMQQLQPRLKELQKKFAGDKQKLNQETMQLFKAHKVNPMGGCLPMLLQFPIYIALYKVLWNSIELFHAPFFWFYRDLSAPDPYLITPILLGIFMVAQQKLMPSTSADPAQQKMMMLMPIMFSVFMLFLPVGLVIYILVNTVMSVTQQYMYNHGIGFMDVVRGRIKKMAA